MIYHVMANERDNTRIVEEVVREQEIPSQVPNKDPPQHQHKVPPQVPNDPTIGNATLDDLRDSMQQLAQP